MYARLWQRVQRKPEERLCLGSFTDCRTQWLKAGNLVLLGKSKFYAYSKNLKFKTQSFMCISIDSIDRGYLKDEFVILP